jgi:hypothetical protein
MFALIAAAACMGAACAADPGDPPKTATDAGGASTDAGLISESGGSGSSSGSPSSSGGSSGSSGSSGATTSGSSSLDSSSGGDDATTTGDAPSDAVVVQDVLSCPTCAIELKYETNTPAASTQDIRPWIDLYNHGSIAQNLTELTVRYYFTADGSASQMYACDYATITCTLIQSKFVTMATPKPTADHYLEISFMGGSIPPGSHTDVIQNRFHDSSFAPMMQTNDYSFDGTKTTFTDSDHMTVFRNGTLVWGTEP